MSNYYSSKQSEDELSNSPCSWVRGFVRRSQFISGTSWSPSTYFPEILHKIRKNKIKIWTGPVFDKKIIKLLKN